MKKSYEAFLEALSGSESGGKYDIVNRYGYLGKYQFGEMALMDLGYYKSDGKKQDNQFKDSLWTGKKSGLAERRVIRLRKKMAILF